MNEGGENPLACKSPEPVVISRLTRRVAARLIVVAGNLYLARSLLLASVLSNKVWIQPIDVGIRSTRQHQVLTQNAGHAIVHLQGAAVVEAERAAVVEFVVIGLLGRRHGVSLDLVGGGKRRGRDSSVRHDE
jgi:hypothetical protein